MAERPNRLRYLRRLADLTQEELAAKAGLHPQTVSDLERGVYQPKLETAVALSRVFGCSAEDLFVPSETGDVPVEMPSGGAERLQDGREDPTARIAPVGNRPPEIEAVP